MAELTEVGVVAGVPNSGTGEVPTLAPVRDAITAISKAEDTAHASGDKGVMALAVRKDTAATLGTDGDYSPLRTDQYGDLNVLVVNPAGSAVSFLPAGQANMANSNPMTIASDQTWTGAAGLGKAEDAAHTTGDVGVMGLAVRQDTIAALAGTAGDYIPQTTDQYGLLQTGPDSLTLSPAGVTSATTIFSQDLTGYESISVQVTSAGSATITYECSDDNTTWYTSAGNATSGTAGAETTSTSLSIRLFPRRARYFRARVSAYSSGTVTVVATLHKSPASTPNILTATGITGAAAHDAAISGAPVRLGARALTANYTAVATGDVADLVTTLVGALVGKPYSIPELDWHYVAAASGIANTTTAVTLVGAAAAGIRSYITSIDIMAEPLGAATEIAIRDGAGGTVLWRGKLGTSGAPAGYNVKFPSPLKSTAATLLEFLTLTASVTGAVYVNAHGYQAP